MKSKLSLRKKIIIQIISPTLITINMAIISIHRKDSMLSYIIIILAIALYLLMLFNTYRKNCEPEDEMARSNQQKADSLSFNIMSITVAAVMLYCLTTKIPVVLSELVLLLIFAGMNILNLGIFLFYDMRGN